MSRANIISFLTVWSMSYGSVLPTNGADPTAEELIRLAPTVKSGDPKYSKVEISTYVDGGDRMQQVFRVQYRSPDRYSLCIADGRDNTPIIYVSDNQLLMYCAVDGLVLYLSNVSFSYAFRLEGGEFSQSYRIRPGGASSVLFDVKSLYDREGIGDVVARAEGGAFRLTRKLAGGKSFSALVDPSRRCPFSQIALMKIGSDEPFLLVRELSVNEDVRGAWPAFPPKDRLAGRVGLKDLSNDAEFRDFDVVESSVKGLLGRPAIRNKEAREAYEERFGVRKDWNKIEESDRRLSRSVRELIGTPIGNDAAREGNAVP